MPVPKPTYIESYRLACEVRYVLGLDSKDLRRKYLQGVREKRGDAGADILEREIKLAWEAR